jgi:phospholipase/lecithinase/hemolysin
MALTLNPFRRYIDLKTSEGLKTFNSALHGFESPLAESAKINLVPQDFQKLSEQLNCLGSQYGYDHLFKRAATTRTIIPATPAIAAVAAIAADLTVVPPIIAVPAVAAVPATPETTLYGGFRNMIENYSADNLKIAEMNASVTWGDDSFTAQKPQTIREMTIANGLAMTPTNLKPSKLGEVLQLTRMHSKFMAHQLMALLTPTARQAVK